jgi:hypothetical protein
MRTAISWAAAALPLLLAAYSPVYRPQETLSQSFDPGEIQIRMNPDIDIVYHTLAHFAGPGTGRLRYRGLRRMSSDGS